MYHHNNDEEGELHQLGSMFHASTEDDSSDNHIDFSDERTDGKVEIKRGSDGEVTFINQHDDYFYRPTTLHLLNYLEFFCLFEKATKKKRKEGTHGRQSNLTLEFQ